ncbi:MAG: PipX family protein [Synechococcales bacterium]|nr:PipX family protein [Synechococcales bacterium]
MALETYLTHPTFGLLCRVCLVEDNCELFTTLYAQRLFFLVSPTAAGIQFEAVGRASAKMLVENRLRFLRRNSDTQEYNQLMVVHKQTFQ